MREKLSEHFYEDEFWCKHCRGLELHPGFIERLQDVRTWLNRPMHVTSGCRCVYWNEQQGGHPKSLHVFNKPMHSGQHGTLAVDIACTDGEYRGQLFEIAWRHGFSVGWNAKRGFLHLDLRTAIGLSQTSFDY